MDKFEALEHINATWHDPDIPLGEKILTISNAFYAVGLDLSTTAAYIKATPAELDALLSLGALDEDIIELISKVDPPKTTWPLLASASDDEVKQALDALSKSKGSKGMSHSAISEFVYQQMIEVTGPTTEQLVGMLTGQELAHALKKGQDFNAFSDWENRFMKSIVVQKKRGKTLSDKQLAQVLKILVNIAEKGVIKRDSIDGDKDICDKILDAIGK